MREEITRIQERIVRERAKLADAIEVTEIGKHRGKPKARWLGNGRVQVGDETLALEPQFADVLQALVELKAATKPDLQKHSGRDNPDRIIRDLLKRYPVLDSYITRPGKRGQGGYRTTIAPGAN